MRIQLTFVCWLLGCCAVAQIQITDFENKLLKLPTQALVVDTLNGKLLFSVNSDELASTSLWVTDGTVEKTFQLSDSIALSPSSFSYKVRKYGYIYLKGQYLWRTNGKTVERINSPLGVPQKIFDVGTSVLLTQSHLQNLNGQNVSVTSFAWLDSLNRTTPLEEDVVSYQIIDSTLHYIRYNKESKLYELGKVYKNGKFIKNIIVREINFNFEHFDYISQNGIDFYFLETGTGKKLIRKPANSTDNLSYEDWGGGTYFPAFLKDSAQHIYFLKHYGSLTFYELSADNQFIEKWVISAENVARTYQNESGYYNKYDNWMLDGSKLIYRVIIAGEALYRYYFNSLDLKTGVNQQSRNLREYFRFYYYALSVKPLGADTYMLDNLANTRITYSFPKDTVSQVITYPFKNNLIDTTITFRGNKFQLADNIYLLNGTTKTPLVSQKQVFDKQPDVDFFSQIQLGDKLLFLRYSTLCQCHELSVSDSKKNSNTLLMTIDGQPEQFADLSIKHYGVFLGRIYIQVRNPQTGALTIYETDGTKEGSKKSYTYQGNRLEWLKANDRQLVFRENINGEGFKLVILGEDRKWFVINIPVTSRGNEVYVTSTNTYILTKSFKFNILYNELYTIEGDSLILVDNDVDQAAVYQNRLYYSRWVTQANTNALSMRFAEAANGDPALAIDGIAGFQIYGDKLVCHRANAETGADYTIIDLITHKAEHTVHKILPIFTIYVKGVLVIADNGKLYLIKDGKRKEYTIGFRVDYIVEFNTGILLKGGLNLTYYDLLTDQTSAIVENREAFTPMFIEGGTYLLIYARNNESVYKWYYWTIADKKLIAFEDGWRFEALNPSQIYSFNSANQNIYFWSFTGNSFINKYSVSLDYYHSDNMKYLNNNFYLPYVTDKRGAELAKAGTDSLILYPEIVQGKEGIILGDVFKFKDTVFVYAFTKATGWQVWRMDKEPALILSNEPVLESDLLKIYPNPTQDLLYINTEKTLPFKLINARGQLIKQGSLSSHQEIDIRQFPQGIYLIQLFDENRVYVRKLVKE